MITTLCFVIIVVIFHKLWSVGCWFRIHDRTLVRTIAVILRTLLAQLYTHLITLLCRALVKVSIGIDASHIIHGGGNCSLDSRVVGGSIDGKTAPTADAQDSDAVGIDKFVGGEIIHCGTEILCVQVGRCHIARYATAFTCKRRVEGDSKETSLGKCLGVKP